MAGICMAIKRSLKSPARAKPIKLSLESLSPEQGWAGREGVQADLACGHGCLSVGVCPSVYGHLSASYWLSICWQSADCRLSATCLLTVYVPSVC